MTDRPRDRLLTTDDVVALLALDSDGCSREVARERLRNLRRARRIPFVRLSPRTIRYRAADIAALIDRCLIPAVRPMTERIP